MIGKQLRVSLGTGPVSELFKLALLIVFHYSQWSEKAIESLTYCQKPAIPRVTGHAGTGQVLKQIRTGIVAQAPGRCPA